MFCSRLQWLPSPAAVLPRWGASSGQLECCSTSSHLQHHPTVREESTDASNMQVDEAADSNRTMEEANMLASSASNSEKSESETDTSKDRQAGM